MFKFYLKIKVKLRFKPEHPRHGELAGFHTFNLWPSSQEELLAQLAEQMSKPYFESAQVLPELPSQKEKERLA